MKRENSSHLSERCRAPCKTAKEGKSASLPCPELLVSFQMNYRVTEGLKTEPLLQKSHQGFGPDTSRWQLRTATGSPVTLKWQITSMKRWLGCALWMTNRKSDFTLFLDHSHSHPGRKWKKFFEAKHLLPRNQGYFRGLYLPVGHQNTATSIKHLPSTVSLWLSRKGRLRVKKCYSFFPNLPPWLHNEG